jgi:hypothetical protein
LKQRYIEVRCFQNEGLFRRKTQRCFRKCAAWFACSTTSSMSRRPKGLRGMIHLRVGRLANDHLADHAALVSNISPFPK